MFQHIGLHRYKHFTRIWITYRLASPFSRRPLYDPRGIISAILPPSSEPQDTVNFIHTAFHFIATSAAGTGVFIANIVRRSVPMPLGYLLFIAARTAVTSAGADNKPCGVSSPRKSVSALGSWWISRLEGD